MTENSFFKNLDYQNNPLSAVTDFLEAEERFEHAQQTDRMRFVGYVLDLGYDNATIITSDPYKVAVGGIPRGSFLILAPNNFRNLPPHFTLLRVMETAPTPLSGQIQQTYFELHKKSMPELDVWTQSELQWGALKCAVLGMFYPDKKDRSKVAFSGDVNSIVSAHRYRVFAPNEELLDIIVNGLVNPANGRPVAIGFFRPTENELASILAESAGSPQLTTVNISVDDFKGTRCAMFGKTRLGKSNVVKLLVQSIIDATQDDASVGQLIFDINGEYANDNPQDGSSSIRSANEQICDVYALTQRPNTPSKPLRLNFYEQPTSGMQILASLLEQDGLTSNYIAGFASVELPSIEDANATVDQSKRTRQIRKIQTYWAILHKAGFGCNEESLRFAPKISGAASAFDPRYNKDLRSGAYARNDNIPDPPRTLDELTAELESMIAYARSNSEDPSVKKAFTPDDHALFDFLVPKLANSTGPAILNRYRIYHDPRATDFVVETLRSLDQGRTVILDLGNANDRIRAFFADRLSREVFAHQERKFTSNQLGNHYVHLYFEEAHNLFPASAKDLTGVYARFAKEGAKFHIGMTYSTQSPSTIYGELLNQTENFFVGHLSSSDETKTLTRLQNAFTGVEDEIMRSRTPGYMRMLTKSHRFVIPVQTHLYEAGGQQ